MLSDQAQEIVRNSPEGIGAEVWRKLLWEYEPGVGIRYGAMLQSLLKRRFGEHDETDLAREIESFERDISKYEQQSNDLISDAIKHGIVCGGMAHQGLKQHIDLSISRLSTYKTLRDEIINYSRARRTWTDPNAMQVDAVHMNVSQERQGGSSGSRSEKGKGGRSKSKKGGKGKEREEKAASKFNGECRYCQKKGHKKADCRKMKADIDAGRCDKSGKPKGVNALTAAGSTQPSPQASFAPSLASTIPLQQVVPMYCSQTPHHAKTWFINTIMPVQKTLMVASLDGAEYALLDSGSGLTSCPIDYADDLPLLPRPINLPILSNATGGSVECIGQRQVGYRLENGEPFVVMWHVANVTNLIISTESLMAANIEVRHARNESSMIMDKCGIRSSVVLHKFAKVSWLKLYRDNSVLDSDLRIAAINANAMAIDEIDSDEERRSRLRRKKETFEMDDNLEIQGTRGTEGSDARSSRDPVPLPLETSIAQRSAPDLVLWSDEPGGLLEPAQEERKVRGDSVPIGPNPAEKATHELTHVSFRNWCSYCVRARAADDLHHRQPHKEPEFPIIMADYCFMQDSHGGELFTILDMLDVALGMMAAISVEEKGPSMYVVSAVVEHLRAWGREKVIFRIDGEPAFRALGVAIQYARSEETVIECRPKYSSPSMDGAC